MLKKRLHQLFNDAVLMPVARLPLIGPHGRHDVKLLLSGAKPAAIVAFPSPEEKLLLDSALEEGRLITCRQPVSATARIHFYTAPGFETEAAALQTVLSKPYPERNMTPEQEQAFHKRIDETGFFGDSIIDTNGMGSLKRKLLDEIDRISCKLQSSSLTMVPGFKLHALRQNMMFSHGIDELVQGRRMIGAFAEHGGLTPEMKAKLDRAAADGKLIVSSHDSNHSYMMILYGRPGQEENMKKIAALHNWKNGDPEPERPYIGELLGYSDRDEALWENGWPKNKIVSNLLYATQDMRRELRTKLMLDAGINWKRNMD